MSHDEYEGAHLPGNRGADGFDRGAEDAGRDLDAEVFGSEAQGSAGASTGRTERGPDRTGRRAVIAGGAVALAALGGGAAALMVVNRDRLPVIGGGSDGGGRAPSRTDATTAPPPPPPAEVARAAVAALPDQSALVPELATTDLSRTGMLVSFPRIPGARGLSEAIDIAAGKMLRERLFRGQSATLTAAGRVIASGSGVLGVLLDATDEQGPSASLLWYRAEGDRPFTSPALVRAESWGALRDAVLSAAAGVEGTDPEELRSLLQEQPRPFGNGPALLPQADGALQVLFPSASAGGSRGELVLTVPAATAASLLSEDGAAVQQALAAPAPFDPSLRTVPGDSHDGDALYVLPAEVDAPAPVRVSEAPGPRTQLAPLVGDGVRPASVVAPDASRLRSVSLTLDDGPSPDLNARVRGDFAAAQAAATFFMIGQSVAEWPDAVAKTCADGHEISSHSWSHPQLTKLSADSLASQLQRTTDAIIEACGRVPFSMRPPYGARNGNVDDAAAALGQSVQIWDVDTLDWQSKSPQKIMGHVDSETRRGSLMLIHEIHPTSAEAIPMILDWFASNGYTTFTCAELGQNQMYAGCHYTRGLVHGDVVTGPTGSASEGGGASDGGGQG